MLAALVPRPRVNLTQYHGVFAPNSSHRSQVTPAKRVRGNTPKAPNKEQQTTPGERHAAMTWAQRLKRVFNIDIQTCSKCGGAVNVIACIQDPSVIDKILTHLQEKVVPGPNGLLPQSRALLATGRSRIALGPGKKMKVQAGNKTGKQTGEHAKIGQASTPAKTKYSSGYRCDTVYGRLLSKHS